MSLTGLLDVVARDAALAEAIEAAATGHRPHLDLVGPPAARPFVIAALARSLAAVGAERGRPVLAVTATGREAEDLAASLRSLLPPDAVALYPALGDAAARTALAARRHGRPPARGASPARAPEGG